MDKYKSKGIYLFIGIIAIVMAIFTSSSNNFNIVEAGVGGGTGGGVTGGGVGNWNHAYGPEWNGSGTTSAWKSFEKAGRPKHDAWGRNEFEKAINKLGKVGSFDGTLVEACKKSQFIWYHGDDFKVQIGTNVHPTEAQMPHSPLSSYGMQSKQILSTFMKIPNNGWGKRGGTVLICSWTVNKIPEPLTPVNFLSNSGSWIYDGGTKTVSGYKMDKGKLKAGHSHRATASKSRRAVGADRVPFSSAPKIYSGSKDVSKEYKIDKDLGFITILPKAAGADKNCFVTTTDNATAITQNDVSIAKGYLPNGAPGLSTAKKIRYNGAHTALQRMPGEGATKAAWVNWKNGFVQGGKDLKTEDFDLQEMGIADTLSKYGGVLNVTRVHHPWRADATFCQPKERDQYKHVDKNGKETATWGPWYNVGPEKVKSSKSTKQAVKNYSYQILGVNCNLEGFNKVKSQFNTVSSSLGDGSSGALLQTVEKPGLDHPLGKSSHYTGKNVFYNADDVTWKNSCKDTFKTACVSDKLNGSVGNNANENLQKNPLFTEVDKVKYKDNNPKFNGYPNETTGELNFFRDNKDREVRAEVWYPKDLRKVGFVTHPGDAAKRTTGKIFDEALKGGTPTPEIGITTISPWSKKADKFTATGVEKEWGEHINRLNMKSQWASLEGKPYKVGLDWAYDSQVQNVGPSKVDGYVIKSVTAPKSYNFEAHCSFKNAKGQYPANIPVQPYTTPGKIKADWKDSGQIESLFNRSVSDKSK